MSSKIPYCCNSDIDILKNVNKALISIGYRKIPLDFKSKKIYCLDCSLIDILEVQTCGRNKRLLVCPRVPISGRTLDGVAMF
jgi:hypothetical protein